MFFIFSSSSSLFCLDMGTISVALPSCLFNTRLAQWIYFTLNRPQNLKSHSRKRWACFPQKTIDARIYDHIPLLYTHATVMKQSYYFMKGNACDHVSPAWQRPPQLTSITICKEAEEQQNSLL